MSRCDVGNPPRLFLDYLLWRSRPWYVRAWLRISGRGFKP